jgi:hypothetical protein
MTILASGPGITVCGSLGYIHRVKGWRLPSCLVPYVDTPYEDVPTPELERYWSWFCGPDRWLGHYHELAEIEGVLEGREP